MKSRIRELREEHNITQAELANILGIKQVTVSAYETGKHYPSLEFLLKMVEYFNVSSDYILGLSNIRNIGFSINHLTSNEVKIILLFRKMNHIAQEKTAAYMHGLISSPIYTLNTK